MKIIVCGDSFCAATNHHTKDVGERKHFSQLLDDVYKYEVLNLAHGGMSNVGIWFQIQHAISLKPDVIVYNQTWSSRVELVFDENMFNADRGLENFIYTNPYYESTHLPFVGNRQTGTIFSTVWQGLEDNPFIEVSPEQIKAINGYIKYMFHDGLKTTTDTWMFDYWQGKIEQAGMLGIKFNDATIGEIAYEYSRHNQIDCPYHTDAATQEIIAANIHNRIVNS